MGVIIFYVLIFTSINRKLVKKSTEAFFIAV